MHGVVSLLDPQATRLVESLWVELENEFGLSSLYAPRIAHFSYQIAEAYDLKRVGAALERFAQEQQPFSVKTTGLGVFTGSSPILFVPVVRNAELTRLDGALWQAIAGMGSDVSDHYVPASWLPHITLAQGDLNSNNLPQIISWLVNRDFNWDIVVNNVALIYQTGAEHRLKFRFGF